jgi:uncharacterized membrane protein
LPALYRPDADLHGDLGCADWQEVTMKLLACLVVGGLLLLSVIWFSSDPNAPAFLGMLIFGVGFYLIGTSGGV